MESESLLSQKAKTQSTFFTSKKLLFIFLSCILGLALLLGLILGLTTQNASDNLDSSEPNEDHSEAVCILGTQTGCSTAVAIGLTNQIAAELGAMGYSFSTLDSTWIKCSSPCVNKLQTSAANALASAAKSKNDYITLNSAWRSSAQQYLLYNWYQKGICGISIAAKPGTSNHEGGRAIDTSNWSYWLNTLKSYGWSHDVPGDDVHFDYTKAADIAKQNLIAFQRLHNKRNPNNKIAEDGIYGPATANALYNAPCNGW
jgi:N-acetylmuramoyl-L-alanine amidase